MFLSVFDSFKIGIGPPLVFAPDRDLIFDYGPPLPGHPKGRVLQARNPDSSLPLSRIFYSIGGSFVQTAEKLQAERGRTGPPAETANGTPFPFGTAAEMLAMGQAFGLTIAAMTRANEALAHGPALDSRLDAIWSARDGCRDRGLRHKGILPGGLSVRRQACGFHRQPLAEQGRNPEQPQVVTDWISVYAMAVNAENAAETALAHHTRKPRPEVWPST